MGSSKTVDYLVSLQPEARIGLLARLTHEINSPLTVINGFADLILTGGAEISPEIRAVLEKITLGQYSVDRSLKDVSSGADISDTAYLDFMGVAIDQLLTPIPPEGTLSNDDNRYLDRIRTSQRKLAHTFNIMFGFGSPETFFFKSYVELYSNINRETLQTRGVELFNQTITFPLETNTLDYEIVLDNLLGNAIKHGFKEKSTEGKKRFIKVATRANYGPCLVRVSDNGSGFDLDSITEKASSAGIIPRDYHDIPIRDLLNIIGDQGLYVSGNIAQKALNGADYRNQLLMQLAFLPGISTSENGNGLDLVYGGAGTSQGLGLDNVKTLVERNGGNVWVISHPRDTRFYFTVPEDKVISK
jgi:signal transduction histidine kinase